MCTIFKGLGKIFVAPEGLGPMNHQILRANVKKSGGELATKLDTSVSIVCIQGDTSSSTLESLAAKCSPNTAFVDAAWIQKSVGAKKLLRPSILHGAPPKSLFDANVDDEHANPTPSDPVEGPASQRQKKRTAEAIEENNDIGDDAEPKHLGAFTTGWSDDKYNCLMRWVSRDFVPTPKVAAFDLDGTLIVPKSGRAFPQGPGDWRLLGDAGVLKARLRELVDGGFCLVIISNQAGVLKGHSSPDDFRVKLAAIQAALGLPLAAFAAYGANRLRKPAPGAWLALAREWAAAGAAVAAGESFYVGDAAGRGPGRKAWSGWDKKDHSDSDRKFAINAGLPFHCPESFFLRQAPQPHSLSGVDPAALLAAAAPDLDPPLLPSKGKQELVVLVGWPGSGKTSLARSVFLPAGYVWVNRDTLKDVARCHREAQAALSQGKSVVVDATHPSAKARADYLALAHKAAVPARCLVMAADRALAEHLNQVRQLRLPVPSVPVAAAAAGGRGAKKARGAGGGESKGEEQHGAVPAIAMRSFQSAWEDPSPGEGFASVARVPFNPRFDSDDHRTVFLWRL